MNNDSNIDFPKIAEINANLSENILHYDPQRIDYAISSLEIDSLKNFQTSIWKDVFFATSSLAIATLVNGIVLWLNLKKDEHLNLSIFLNLVVGCVCLIMGIISFSIWQSNKKSFDNLIENIKSKPAYKLPTI
jgi:hypothetical protein